MYSLPPHLILGPTFSFNLLQHSPIPLFLPLHSYLPTLLAQLLKQPLSLQKTAAHSEGFGLEWGRRAAQTCGSLNGGWEGGVGGYRSLIPAKLSHMAERA